MLVSFSSVDRRLPGRAGQTWPMGGREEEGSCVGGSEVAGRSGLPGKVAWTWAPRPTPLCPVQPRPPSQVGPR